MLFLAAYATDIVLRSTRRLLFFAAYETDIVLRVHAIGQVVPDRAAEQTHQEDSNEPYDAVR